VPLVVHFRRLHPDECHSLKPAFASGSKCKNATEGPLRARLAALAGSAVRAPGQRIASIEFDSDEYTWRAEAGRTLRGAREVKRIRNKRKVDVTERTSDPATVLAMFAGEPQDLVEPDSRVRGVDLRPLRLSSAWCEPAAKTSSTDLRGPSARGQDTRVSGQSSSGSRPTRPRSGSRERTAASRTRLSRCVPPWCRRRRRP
jgi:hypothetical protein